VISPQFQNNSSRLSMPCRNTAKKSRTYANDLFFRTILVDHHHCPPFLQPDFQQFHTTSQPRRYYQRTQLPDSVKDFPKERLRNSHFRHLKYHVTGMTDHLGSYLEEFISECSQGPLLHRLRKSVLTL